MSRLSALVAASLVAMLPGCAHSPPTVTPVSNVDLERFMGDWYVIAHIPSWPERDAYNAIESYTLRPDGRIQTTFRYRRGSFDAPVRTMHPVGTVRPNTRNAVWDMQFIWPIQAEYVIAGLNPAYSHTVIARSKRDYAWIMARTPRMEPADYEAAVAQLTSLGYRVEQLRIVPQQWPESAPSRLNADSTP